METKELIIEIPDGYEIDQEKSTFEKIVFKKKEDPTTYEEVADLSIRGKDGFGTKFNGKIESLTRISDSTYYPNTALTKEQLEWLMALNKLQNVANYLNDGWVPDWKDEHTEKYFIWYNHVFNEIQTDYTYRHSVCDIHFKSRELAHKAIEILGEEEVKKALGVYKGG